MPPRLRCLSITCLQEHKEVLQDELEPLNFCDFLLEESAIEILVHDRITETNQRQKQIKYLLETIEENNHDCFHFFLYILQKEEYSYILEELESSVSEALAMGNGMSNFTLVKINMCLFSGLSSCILCGL